MKASSSNDLSQSPFSPRSTAAHTQSPLPLPEETSNPVWLSVAEAAKIGGVTPKTIRRAIEAAAVTFKVIGNRYAINMISLIEHLSASTKLRNKFNRFGLGQYVDKWKK